VDCLGGKSQKGEELEQEGMKIGNGTRGAVPPPVRLIPGDAAEGFSQT